MIDLKARLHDALSTARDILHDGNTDKKAIIPDAALENDSDLSEEEFIDAETEEHPSSLLTGASEPDPDPHRDTSPERIVSPQDDVEDILNTENDSIRKGKSLNNPSPICTHWAINMQTSCHGLLS